MSAPPVTQPDAETPLNPFTNGIQQAVSMVEAAGSETSSGNEELAPTNISERLDQMQNTMNQLVQDIATVNANIATVNANIATVNANIATVNANIATVNANIATVNANIALGTNKIIQNSADISQIKQNTATLTKLMSKLTKNVMRNDVNTQARITNSHAKLPTDRLRPLLNTAYVNCQKFPATLAELDGLDNESIVDILKQLDLAIDGNAHATKSRLQDHIGVLT